MVGPGSGSRSKAGKAPKSFTFSKKLEKPKHKGSGQPEAAVAGAPKGGTGSVGKSAEPAKGDARNRKLSGKGDGALAAETLDAARPDKDGYVVFKGRRVRVISTKNVKKRRPLTAAARAQRDRELQAQSEPDKPILTKLSKKELDHYRDLLLLLRSQKLGDLSAKEAEALQSNGGNLSHMPIHMADIGTDAYEQDFTLGLAESDRKLIREIDEALARIEQRTYGMCMLTGKPIPKSRLNAKPWAKYTIEAARMVENGQVA
jgi:RNA polymerase-binding protein DksA